MTRMLEPVMNVRIDPDTISIKPALQAVSPPFRRYLIVTAFAFGILQASAACFNYLVDPYMTFGRPRLEGFKALKPSAIKQVKISQAYQVCRGHYRTILMGNSRVDVGLNPKATLSAFTTLRALPHRCR